MMSGRWQRFATFAAARQALKITETENGTMCAAVIAKGSDAKPVAKIYLE